MINGKKAANCMIIYREGPNGTQGVYAWTTFDQVNRLEPTDKIVNPNEVVSVSEAVDFCREKNGGYNVVVDNGNLFFKWDSFPTKKSFLKAEAKGNLDGRVSIVGISQNTATKVCQNYNLAFESNLKERIAS